MTISMLLTSFNSSVEDNKLCTNIECLEGKLKHTAADQISHICIYWAYKLQHYLKYDVYVSLKSNLILNILDLNAIDF